LEKAGNEIKAFLDYLPTDVPKAKATASRKRVKDLPPDDSGIDWKELFENRTVDTCKVDQLKKRLKSLGRIFQLLIFYTFCLSPHPICLTFALLLFVKDCPFQAGRMIWFPLSFIA
jgi:hypothetical protein